MKNAHKPVRPDVKLQWRDNKVAFSLKVAVGCFFENGDIISILFAYFLCRPTFFLSANAPPIETVYIDVLIWLPTPSAAVCQSYLWLMPACTLSAQHRQTIAGLTRTSDCRAGGTRKVLARHPHFTDERGTKSLGLRSR